MLHCLAVALFLMAREVCSIFDLLTDARIEAFVPYVTRVAAADAAGGGGEAVVIVDADAGANADANADDSNNDWWEGIGFRIRMRARLLTSSPRADPDSDDD